MYIYIYIHITYVHVMDHTGIYWDTCKYRYICKNIDMYIYIYIHMYACIWIYNSYDPRTSGVDLGG